jgi:hypothetical protein
MGFSTRNFSIHNNSDNGNVGFVLGNIYNYKDENEVIKELQSQNILKDSENKFLKEKLSLLEDKIKNLEEIIRLMKNDL